MPRVRRFTALTLSALLVCATSASADVVTDWNVKAVFYAATPPRGPAVIVDLAIVHAAIHDAIQAYDKRFEPYAVTLNATTGSLVAAAARAARDVLVARLPSSQTAAIHDDYLLYLANKGLTDGDPGVLIGQAAAAAVLALRNNDGSFPTGFPEVATFRGGTAPGEWRPTPPANAAMFGEWLGAVRTFAISDPLDYSPAPLPALTSAEYTEAYNEVKAVGSNNSTTRSASQTHLAKFYGDNFIMLWERTLSTIASDHYTNPGDSARLLALANIAAADAIITAWRSKRDFNFWRPITAIREGQNDGNPGTIGDPAWTPFITTPPYADYTSGANSLTGSMTRILASVMGSDHVTFEVESRSTLLVGNDAKTIEYTKFSDMAKDVVDVRIYQGIHFRFADTEARAIARRIANFVVRNFLQPVAN